MVRAGAGAARLQPLDARSQLGRNGKPLQVGDLLNAQPEGLVPRLLNRMDVPVEPHDRKVTAAAISSARLANSALTRRAVIARSPLTSAG